MWPHAYGDRGFSMLHMTYELQKWSLRKVCCRFSMRESAQRGHSVEYEVANATKILNLGEESLPNPDVGDKWSIEGLRLCPRPCVGYCKFIGQQLGVETLDGRSC